MELQDGVIELALHREPCNELGSLSLYELERFASALDDLSRRPRPHSLQRAEVRILRRR